MLRNRRVCSVAALQRKPRTAFSGAGPAAESSGEASASCGSWDEGCSCSGVDFSTAPDESAGRDGVGEALVAGGASEGFTLPWPFAPGAARSAPAGGGEGA